MSIEQTSLKDAVAEAVEALAKLTQVIMSMGNNSYTSHQPAKTLTQDEINAEHEAERELDEQDELYVRMTGSTGNQQFTTTIDSLDGYSVRTKVAEAFRQVPRITEATITVGSLNPSGSDFDGDVQTYRARNTGNGTFVLTSDDGYNATVNATNPEPVGV